MFFSVDVFLTVRIFVIVFGTGMLLNVFLYRFCSRREDDKQVQHSAAFGITVENVCANQTWEILKCLKSTSKTLAAGKKK